MRASEAGLAAFLAAVRSWRPSGSGETGIAPPSPCWDAESGLLVAGVAHPEGACRIFLSGWERGIYWASDWRGRLEVMPSHLDPELPLLCMECGWAIPWLGRIPADVLETLARFRSEQWALLCWCSREPAALDLLRSAPLLLWLLLTVARQNEWPEPKIEDCLRDKRRDILAACGFHPAQSTLRLLGKLVFPGYGRQAFGLASPWLRDPGLGASLRHYRAVSEAQLLFLRNHPEQAALPMVREAASEGAGYFQDLERVLADVRRMREDLAGGPEAADPLRGPRPQDLLGEHERLVRRLNALETVPDGDEGHYPAPPIPGTDTIVPVPNHGELALEGHMQAHCVRSYHRQIKAGGYYVYKVLQPQRATLGLSLTPGLPCRIDQLTGHGNAPVSEETRRRVQDWLDTAQGVPKDAPNPRKKRPSAKKAGARDEARRAPPAVWDMSEYSRKAVLRVVGIGTPGHGAVRHMLAQGLDGLDLVLLGGQGLPFDSPHGYTTIQPAGQEAAGESCHSSPYGLDRLLAGCDMLVLVASSGDLEAMAAASELARASKARDILTVAAVSRPFPFEGTARLAVAELACRELLSKVDTLLPVSPDRPGALFAGDASAAVHQALLDAVRPITDLITRPTIIGLDFADVRTVTSEMGSASMAAGTGTGEHRARKAAEQALARIVAHTDLLRACGLLVNIASNDGMMTLSEFNEVGNVVHAYLSEATIVVAGMSHQSALGDSVRVSFVATGIDNVLSINYPHLPTSNKSA